MQGVFIKRFRKGFTKEMDWIYGKTFLITGASSGIGRALTIQLIQEHNCKVIGIGRSEEKMLELKQELSFQSDNFRYQLFDVSQPDNWKDFATRCKEENIHIDILINNAGMLPPFNKSVNYTEEQIEECMNVNFHSCRYAINNMIPILRNSDMPAIINVSSAGALAPIIGTSIYSASKAALKAYTECLIAELGREMYIAYACPGFSQTNIFRNQYHQMDSKWIKRASTTPDKIAKKMIKKIIKQKSRMIIGKDAKLLNFTSKHFPILGLKIYELILKHSKSEMFENIK